MTFPFSYSDKENRIVRALGDAGCFEQHQGRTIAHADKAAGLIKAGLLGSRTWKSRKNGAGHETVYWLTSRGEILFRALVAAVNRTCRHCGCTEINACMTMEGPCRWVGAECCSNPACMLSEKKMVKT